jgi:hypothetical protein
MKIINISENYAWNIVKKSTIGNKATMKKFEVLHKFNLESVIR